MKRKLLVIALAVICLFSLTCGTLAYFTASDTAHNVFTSGGLAIDLREWADTEKMTPFPENGVSGVMPGVDVTKIVEVKNTGANDAYIRVQVSKSITLDEGVEAVVDLGLLVIDFDKENWTEKDGYYYYNVALKPGEVTKPLFAAVTFDPAMGNEYQNSTATVDVTAQAVQVANNGTSALTAAGWPTE